MPESQNVLVVPGLYPRSCEAGQRKAYEWAVSRWQADGFNAMVRQFGWNNKYTLQDRQAAFFEAINEMPDRLYTIGASAGALAVPSALQAMPGKFQKIVTIAAPLHLTEAELARFKGNPIVPLPKFSKELYGLISFIFIIILT